jgi:hypothetical protein
VDTQGGYPNYCALLDLIRKNPILSGALSALAPATPGDLATITVTPTVHHVPHVVTVPGRADHSSPSVSVYISSGDDSAAEDDVSNCASVPALRSDPDSAAETTWALPALRRQAFNRSAGPRWVLRC